MTTPPVIDLTCTVSSTAPAHGDTLTFTYVVTGNDGDPARQIEIAGGATIGGQPYTVATTIIKPAIAPLSEVFQAPVSDDLPAFTQDGTNPAVWTVTVP